MMLSKKKHDASLDSWQLLLARASIWLTRVDAVERKASPPLTRSRPPKHRKGPLVERVVRKKEVGFNFKFRVFLCKDLLLHLCTGFTSKKRSGVKRRPACTIASALSRRLPCSSAVALWINHACIDNSTSTRLEQNTQSAMFERLSLSLRAPRLSTAIRSEGGSFTTNGILKNIKRPKTTRLLCYRIRARVFGPRSGCGSL